MAQQSNGAGLRYLSWPGKAAVATPRTAPAVAPAVAVAETPAPTPVRASAPIPLARIAPDPAPTPSSRGLTPASTWLGSPRPAAPAPEPVPAPAPQPAVVEQSAPQPAPVLAPPPAHIAEAAPQAAAPAPVPTQTPAPQPVEAAAVVDPMAPRRDAPIFRLQRPDGSVAAPPQAGAASSARYYSVHRQAGHEPDAIARPAPVYLDALPVQLAQTPTSTDLAQPDGPPTLLRGADGKVRALPQTEADEMP
jgi:hypothetical protein